MNLQTITPFLSLFLGYLAGIFTFNYTFNKKQKNINQKDKLTKLLLPLYIQLKQIDSSWDASQISANYGPAEYLDDLPKIVKSLVPIIRKQSYLADQDFIKTAVEFIRWIEVNTVDEKRFDKIMMGKLNDTDLPYETFKAKVYKLFEEEHTKFLKGTY